MGRKMIWMLEQEMSTTMPRSPQELTVKVIVYDFERFKKFGRLLVKKARLLGDCLPDGNDSLSFSKERCLDSIGAVDPNTREACFVDAALGIEFERIQQIGGPTNREIAEKALETTINYLDGSLRPTIYDNDNAEIYKAVKTVAANAAYLLRFRCDNNTNELPLDPVEIYSHSNSREEVAGCEKQRLRAEMAGEETDVVELIKELFNSGRMSRAVASGMVLMFDEKELRQQLAAYTTKRQKAVHVVVSNARVDLEKRVSSYYVNASESREERHRREIGVHYLTAMRVIPNISGRSTLTPEELVDNERLLLDNHRREVVERHVLSHTCFALRKYYPSSV